VTGVIKTISSDALEESGRQMEVLALRDVQVCAECAGSPQMIYACNRAVLPIRASTRLPLGAHHKLWSHGA
jgi:hypothetical protein